MRVCSAETLSTMLTRHPFPFPYSCFPQCGLGRFDGQALKCASGKIMYIHGIIGIWSVLIPTCLCRSLGHLERQSLNKFKERNYSSRCLLKNDIPIKTLRWSELCETSPDLFESPTYLLCSGIIICIPSFGCSELVTPLPLSPPPPPPPPPPRLSSLVVWLEVDIQTRKPNFRKEVFNYTMYYLFHGMKLHHLTSHKKNHGVNHWLFP